MYTIAVCKTTKQQLSMTDVIIFFNNTARESQIYDFIQS